MTATLSSFDALHANILLFFADLVRSLGGDPDVLMARVGAKPASSRVRVRVSYRQAIELLELAATELDCPDFGLRLATLQGGLKTFGPLGTVMRHSHSLGEALDYVCTHNFAHSLAARVWLKRLPAEEAIFFGHDILLDRIINRSQSIEQIVMLGHLAAIEMTDGHARVRRVYFRHQPSLPVASYRRRFGCDVLFGQKSDGVFFMERDLACPITDADDRIYGAAVKFIEARFGRNRPPMHTQARGLIMQHLGTRHCTNAEICEALGLHQRALHRRLATEGTSFQKIKDEVRRDLMLYYLQRTDMEFARVSEKLGFSEQSVLTRCCHRWLFGSPTEVRNAGGRETSHGIAARLKRPSGATVA